MIVARAVPRRRTATGTCLAVNEVWSLDPYPVAVREINRSILYLGDQLLEHRPQFVPVPAPPMYTLPSRMRPIMSMLIMATALSSGNAGMVHVIARAEQPNSSPAKVRNRMPRFCFGCRSIHRASSITPAVPEALSSAPG